MPPAQAPEGHAAERPIHPRGGTGNEETDGEEGVDASKACYALARSECVCTFAYSLIQGCTMPGTIVMIKLQDSLIPRT